MYIYIYIYIYIYVYVSVCTSELWILSASRLERPVDLESLFSKTTENLWTRHVIHGHYTLSVRSMSAGVAQEVTMSSSSRIDLHRK